MSNRLFDVVIVLIWVFPGEQLECLPEMSAPPCGCLVAVHQQNVLCFFFFPVQQCIFVIVITIKSKLLSGRGRDLDLS